MRKRTLARECALQVLYQQEITGSDAESAVGDYWEGNPSGDEVKAFAEKLIFGTVRHLPALDEVIAKHTENWQLSRMAVVDKTILRQATYELLFLSQEIPPKVVINEAVNLAKKFSQAESGKFVNGVLDKINHTESRRD